MRLPPTERMAAVLARRLAIPELAEPHHAAAVRAVFVLAGVGMVLRAVFWAYTQRYWEDALITCLHSENFASGLGMTHVRPGEPPLHGFTSPLSVLVPLMADLVHVGWGVDFLKLVSIPASALTVLYLAAIGLHRDVRMPAAAVFVAAGYAAIEHHQILWGMSGMETQLAALTLIASIYYTMSLRTVPLGLSLGLCMLARPDYAFWTIIAGLYVLVRRPRAFVPAVAIALAVYLPWIAFTVAHYGSPIPNTILAKGAGYPKWWERYDAITFQAIKRHTWMKLAEELHVMLGPTFCGHGAGIVKLRGNSPESPIGNAMFALAALGGLAIVARRQWVLWPLLACVAVYSAYYVYSVPVIFGWYKIPYLLTLLLLSARGLHAVSGVLPVRGRGAALALFAVAYLYVFARELPGNFAEERKIQRLIEAPVRKAAGLWLRERMQPHEKVGCEPLGYIAYYSRGNVYDWPGLASRTVTQWSLHTQSRRYLDAMLMALEPEWLFLRDMELLFWFEHAAWFRAHYAPVALFQAPVEDLVKMRWAGRNLDTSFRIYRRKDLGDAAQFGSVPWPSGEEFAARHQAVMSRGGGGAPAPLPPGMPSAQSAPGTNTST